MGLNDETIITKRMRKALEAGGAHCVKLSDQFTRGIPDMLCVATSVKFIEFKVDRRSLEHRKKYTWKQLGLSGAQDHHIRQMWRRVDGSAYVLTDTIVGDNTIIWYPVDAQIESKYGKYQSMMHDRDEVISWLLET